MLKKFKKRLIVGMGLTILSSCTHYVYINKSQWQNDKIIVDGKSSEWTIPLKFYDDKSKLQYAIANDNENLYVCIRATEEVTQRKIYAAGMQIILDTAEITKKNTPPPPYILFPIGGKERGMNINSEDLPGQNIKFPKPFFELKTMELSGFTSPLNDGIYPIQNKSGIEVNIGSDNNKIVVYELVVPFKTFYKNALSPSDSSKIISITILLNGLPVLPGGMPGSMRPRGDGPPGAGSPHVGTMLGNGRQMSDASAAGMGGGMPGGTNEGMNGETPPYSDSNAGMFREYLSEKNTIKARFQLAIKK